MNKSIYAALAAGFLITGCHHFAGHEPADAASQTQLADVTAIQAFAIDAVYTAHPTRALVDSVETTPTGELGRFLVHVEMTGGAAFRDIFHVVVFEATNGDLEVISLEQVQGN